MNSPFSNSGRPPSTRRGPGPAVRRSARRQRLPRCRSTLAVSPRRANRRPLSVGTPRSLRRRSRRRRRSSRSSPSLRVRPAGHPPPAQDALPTLATALGVRSEGCPQRRGVQATAGEFRIGIPIFIFGAVDAVDGDRCPTPAGVSACGPPVQRAGVDRSALGTCGSCPQSVVVVPWSSPGLSSVRPEVRSSIPNRSVSPEAEGSRAARVGGRQMCRKSGRRYNDASISHSCGQPCGRSF